MPPASRLGGIGSGHGCFPPSPATAGSPTVKIDGLPALRVGDPLAAHGCAAWSRGRRRLRHSDGRRQTACPHWRRHRLRRLDRATMRGRDQLQKSRDLRHNRQEEI